MSWVINRSVRHLLDTHVEASPGEISVDAAGIDAALDEALVDDAWWAEHADVLANGLSGLFARRWPPMIAPRWDERVFALVAGVAVRFAGVSPAGDVLALKARRWLSWWRMDIERHRAAGVALGVADASWEAAAGPTARSVLGVVLCRRPVAAASEVLLAVQCRLGGWSRVLERPARWGVLGRLQEQSGGGFPVGPLGEVWDGPRVGRPWLWCWEMNDGVVPDRRIRWVDGDPVPVPVVVPADWVPAMGDQYGFAALRVPGEQLVVEDMREVLRVWSSRLYRPFRAGGGERSFGLWREVAVERLEAIAAASVEVAAPRLGVVEARSDEVVPGDVDAESDGGPLGRMVRYDEARLRALRAFGPWRGLGDLW